MNKVFLIFPHQLFREIFTLEQAGEVYLIEEYLFFNQYKYHKQKLVLLRASMKYYENYLQDNGIKVTYIPATSVQCDVRVLIAELKQKNFDSIEFYDVCDNWLEKRIIETCKRINIPIKENPTPLFINSKDDLKIYFGTRQKYVQTDFYIQQRKILNILIESNGKPKGGKWSFDPDNRLKYPKVKIAPKVVFPAATEFHKEAIEYVEKNYSNNFGNISNEFIYPATHQQSILWLNQFLETRFSEFGEYEDAIVNDEHILHHSVLAPILNIGLLLPLEIIDAAIDYGTKHNISLNSLEGFIRQIIGWREFIRGVYVYKGAQERTTNYWKFNKEIPSSFYSASTGIEPIDKTIKKLLKTAYNHHIERLMILGNFMLLCEFNPDRVYQWFMEMYIDAYDWVMVPNVYGMSQFSDGGIVATKPYISGSNYLMKMGDYRKGAWQEVWDGLFWRFMHVHRYFFINNPRLGLLVRSFDRMDAKIRQNHLKLAECYLSGLG